MNLLCIKVVLGDHTKLTVHSPVYCMLHHCVREYSTCTQGSSQDFKWLDDQMAPKSKPQNIKGCSLDQQCSVNLTPLLNIKQPYYKLSCINILYSQNYAAGACVNLEILLSTQQTLTHISHPNNIHQICQKCQIPKLLLIIPVTLNLVTCIIQYFYKAFIFHCICITSFDLFVCVTEVSITPSTLWGGQGLLGMLM